MGIYFRTVFYRDIRRKGDGGIILGNTGHIIDDADRDRGYVVKEDLLRFYGSKIRVEDIGEYSRLEEEMCSTYGPDFTTECCLPIR